MFDTKPTATAPSYPEIREGFSDRSCKHLWADTRVKTIRGSVNKFAKVCRVALDISDPADKPTDSDQIAFQFADILASGKVPKDCGVRTPKALFELLSNVRAAIDVIRGRRAGKIALSHRQDDWAELIAYLNGERGGNVIFGSQEMVV